MVRDSEISILQLVNESDVTTMKERHEKIPSLIQLIDYDSAILQNLSLPEGRPDGRQGHYVEYRPRKVKKKGRKTTYVHPFVSIRRLSKEFYDTPQTEDIKKSQKIVFRDDALDSYVIEDTVTQGGGKEGKDVRRKFKRTQLIYPNLDIILSKAQPSPAEFILSFYESNWYYESCTIGSIAILMTKFVNEMQACSTWLNLTKLQQGVLTLSVLFHFLNYNNNGPTMTAHPLWMGCPTVPELLIPACQWRYQTTIDSVWRPSKRNQLVQIMNDLSSVYDRIVGVTTKLDNGETCEARLCEEVLQKAETLKMSSSVNVVLNWSGLCKLCDIHSIDSDLKQIRRYHKYSINSQKCVGEKRKRQCKAEDEEKGTCTPVKQIRTIWHSATKYSVFPAESDINTNDAKETQGTAVHGTAAVSRLESLLFKVRGCTKNITIDDARLLVESVGDDVKFLPPGGSDLGQVQKNELIADYVQSVHLVGCGSAGASLRRVPVVSLLKLATLRMTASDGWRLEYFGRLAWSNYMESLSSTSTNFDSSPEPAAVDDLWAELVNLHDLQYAVAGLCMGIDALLHPSVLQADDVRRLYTRVEHVYTVNNGRLDVPAAAAFMHAALSAHIQALQNRARGATGPVPDLCACTYRDDRSGDKGRSTPADMFEALHAGNSPAATGPVVVRSLSGLDPHGQWRALPTQAVLCVVERRLLESGLKGVGGSLHKRGRCVALEGGENQDEDGNTTRSGPTRQKRGANHVHNSHTLCTRPPSYCDRQNQQPSQSWPPLCDGLVGNAWHDVCIRCSRYGHISRDCSRPFGPIMSAWPPRIRTIAEKLRQKERCRLHYAMGTALR